MSEENATQTPRRQNSQKEPQAKNPPLVSNSFIHIICLTALNGA